MRSLRILPVLLLVLVPAAVHAATFVVPPDEWMVDDSLAIVSGTVTDAYPRYTDEGEIETVFTIDVDEVFKGKVGAKQVRIVSFGGEIGGRWMLMVGAARYQVGQRYLVFMTHNKRGAWATHDLTLGRFEFAHANGLEVLVRDGGEIHGWDIYGKAAVETPRRASEFLSFIRERVAGRKPEANYFVDGVVRNAPERHEFTANADGEVAPTFTGYDFDDASEKGTSEWVDDSGSTVNYSVSGTPASGNTKNLNDGQERIIEEDPNGDIDGAFSGSGVVATAFMAGGADHDFEGATFITITESDIVTQNGVKNSGGLNQNLFRTVMVHEVGHTLGFRHSNQTPDGDSSCSAPLPCTSSAVMNSSVAAFNGNLQSWDTDAVRAAYGGGGDALDYTLVFCGGADCNGRRTSTSTAFRLAKEGCTAVGITTQPQNKNISLGANTTLTVTASGTGPFTYQWYIGNSGDTSTPTGSNSSSLSVSPTTTTSYWVRITNCSGENSVDSNTATVTVTCTNAGITTHPANKTITEGQSTTLSVQATGSDRSYQWYEGSSGDTSKPIGTNSSSINVSPDETTNYWVRVSAACGSPVNSNTATVTVLECADLTIGAPTATPGASAGQFTLSITGSSTSTPLEFEWFRGETPGFGGTKVASTQSFTTTVFAVTSFWARVTNGCDRVKVSSLITVAPCTLPAITTQPEDKTVTSGETTTLSIAFTGLGNVNWYRGTVGDKSAFVGAGTSVTVGPLTETTLFWAEVSNGCGPVASRQVTVTVEPLTETLLMLSGRFTVVVNYINQFENPPTTGRLKGRSLSSAPLSDTAIFTFGDANVIELMVRLSDARPFDNHIHVFYGGLSDIEFFITVTDSTTGVSKEYHKPANQLIGEVDRSTFVAVPGSLLQSGIDSLMAETARRAIRPFEDSDTILMLNDRYQVRMRYRNQFVNPPTEGYLLARSIASTTMTETAVFFGDPSSVEWMVRFSDARPFDNHIHFYHGGLTDLELTVEVTDTLTGLHKEYAKPGNTLVGAVDRLSWLP